MKTLNKIMPVIFAAIVLTGCVSMSGGSLIGFGNHDERIYQQVVDKLSRTYDPELEQLEVQVANGVVSVSGYVHKIRQSDNAQFLISQIPGVKDIENNIVVKLN